MMEDGVKVSEKAYAVIGFILLALVVVGINLAHAKLVYGDYKCVVAECRIMK